MEVKEEFFDIVDTNGHVTGLAPRTKCHNDPSILHKAVHLLLFNDAGDLFLQKRSSLKSIQPGRWDTSVGGHVASGEENKAALFREAQEELGISLKSPQFLYTYIWKCPKETELINTWKEIVEQNVKIKINKDEITEGRFWKMDEIQYSIKNNSEIFTPNFIHEIERYNTQLS
ncbi:MAG: NUDIX domain-containing protein [Candidatus Aureabacteria bacterium]|nr:NUDIX domain-containing protein [Candidatus Auribacterota bacterium]